MNEREIFIAALQDSSDADRAAFLRNACGGDVALQQRIEDLLRAEQKLGSFLESPPPNVFEQPTLDAPQHLVRDEHLGERIGPYKLLQVIGEGGMGVVYLAEQTQPVVRRVALKIIKPGMDSRQVIARFEAERQALAMMDHPSIAKVLDAGATAGGRPFFVMELVKGVPITRYCDQQHVTPRQRLELFIPVCQAVQHAHQKGIIHRDLKPSNVLIALYDGRPVPKVIDFGVAKATSQRLTEKTMFTEVGSIIGTLEYMAPEQAELNNLDIDTRADIYSLGVMLYELLAGSPPFSAQQLRSAAYNEMLRIIREVEPPRPSTRLSSSHELASISANRQLEPQRLTRLVRGDLDWIVMQCLEKQRERRYDTANGLALDLERYLRDEPVLAGPPSSAYRLQKFLRRNKRSVLVAASLLLLLVAGVAGSAWQAIRATNAESLALRNEQLAKDEARDKERARQAAVRSETKAREAAASERAAKQAALQSAAQEREAKEAAQTAAASERKAKEAEAAQRKQAEAVASLLESVFNGVQFTNDGEQFKRNLVLRMDSVAQSLDRDHAGDPALRARLRQSLGQTMYWLGEYPRAANLYEKAWQERKSALGADHADTLYSMSSFIGMCRMTRQDEKAIALSKEYLQAHLEKLGPNDLDAIAAGNVLAWSYYHADQYAECAQSCRDVIAKADASHDRKNAPAIRALELLGKALLQLKDYNRAAVSLEEALERNGGKVVPGADQELKRMLAGAYDKLGRHDEAAKIWEDLGDAAAVQLLASSYASQGNRESAIAMHRRAIEIAERTLPKPSTWTIHAKIELAHALLANGQTAEAGEVFEKVTAEAAADFGKESQPAQSSRYELALFYQGQGKKAEALKVRQELLKVYEARGEENSDNGIMARFELVRSYQANGELGEAEKLLDPLMIQLRDLVPANRYSRRHALCQLLQALTAAKAEERAEAAVTKYLALAREECGTDSLQLGKTLALCSHECLYSGAPKHCQRICQDARALLSTIPDDPHTRLADAVWGWCLAQQRQDDEAAPLLLAGYAKIAEMPLSERERGNFRSTLCTALADVYARQKDPEQAQRWREELKTLQTPSNPATSSTPAPGRTPE